MEYIVNLEKFHGPFDVLFYLIETNEIDIYDIPVSAITDQYIEFLDAMKEMDIEVTCDFLIMASTLLEIKSKMLLPQNMIEADPREELVSQLIEYKKFKELSFELLQSEESESFFIPKSQEEIIIDNDLDEQMFFSEINVIDLLNTLNTLYRQLDTEIINDEEIFSVSKEEYSVKDCIRSIYNKLAFREKINIRELIAVKSRKYVVVLFLSILELSNLKAVKIVQENMFGDIILHKQQGAEI